MKLTDVALPDEDIRQLILQQVRLHSRRCVSEHVFASHANWQSHFDHAIRELVIDLDTYVFGLPSERIEIYKRWPKTWWDAFKERWFPSWALRRWPVKYDEIDIDEQKFAAVCPHIEAPDRNVCFKWLASHKWDDVKSPECVASKDRE